MCTHVTTWPTSVHMWYKEWSFPANSCPISSNSQHPETIRCIEMKYIFNKIYVYDMPYKRSPQQRLRQNLTKINIYRHLSAVAYIRVISKTPKSSKLSKIFKTLYFSTFLDFSRRIANPWKMSKSGEDLMITEWKKKIYLEECVFPFLY